MRALILADQDQWRKVRAISYEVWRKGTKNPPPIETYWPIGLDIKSHEKTTEELDEIWRKYGKRRKN